MSLLENPKIAMISGVTGQDGSYLAEFLLEKGYHVHGLIRRSSVFTTQRLRSDIWNHERFFSHHSDLSDSSNLYSLIDKIRPHEIYNLGAQSHVAVSFEVPEYTGQVDGLGTIRFLNAINSIDKSIKFYQASTSEMFGGIPGTTPQSEETPFYPKSPYGAAKLYAHWLTVNYRESYGLFTCNGILFNHESPRRGETFVTKKISKCVAGIKKGTHKKLLLGNLDAKRDWGYAKDYVEVMWLMLQQEKPSDYVIATGSFYSVRDFVEEAFRVIGINIKWLGTGIDEVGVDDLTGQKLVSIDQQYYRPSEVEHLLGDSSKARKELGWFPKTSFSDLVKMMVEYDLQYNDYGYD